ncbi:aminotransferase class III-fold pyridoxal phosphate-dependent enzyme [Rhizobium leguminosarum]|uniref:aspartate aminotransferase family protein n=1 Tax=Rhizobium ruizarguesonis TaxID=2081791 RepID=UPI0013B7310B|nr:aspartate aminotransferase family protein [Rhizobium ruizarguesonis]NEI06926.1 aminotransferase class III-fold pyridoxal phosphate-dependent enzyme [Rhizobium ruizarguesonis]
MFHPDILRNGRGFPRSRSEHFFKKGRRVFPTGITRVTVDHEPSPLYISRGEGAYLIDVDGNRLLDLNNNFTTLIHGHGFLPVADAVADLLHRGTCFSNPTEHEITLAELLIERIPAIEHIRFVNSGTEAVMFAIKAARAFTCRPGIARIEGAYHGAYDWAETGQAVSPAIWNDPLRSPAVPAYRGMPSSVGEEVTVIRFNDIADLERRIASAAPSLACILIDPMPSRAGLIAPEPSFFAAVEAIAKQYGILIVADEVLNLRQSYMGASARYGLHPDLVAAGKIIGGGFPVGAIGGHKEVMRVFASDSGKPLLPQGGTFSANPVSMVAGRVAMEAMTDGAFASLESLGDRIRAGLRTEIERHGAAFSVTGAASLFRIHPKGKQPTDFREAYLAPEEAELMGRLSRHFLNCGILLPNGAAACLSTAMTIADGDAVIAAFADFLSILEATPTEAGM